MKTTPRRPVPWVIFAALLALPSLLLGEVRGEPPKALSLGPFDEWFPALQIDPPDPAMFSLPGGDDAAPAADDRQTPAEEARNLSVEFSGSSDADEADEADDHLDYAPAPLLADFPRGRIPPSRTMPAADVARIPGEFEPQGALLLCASEMLWQLPEIFADIVAAVQHNVRIVALVNDAEEYRLARTILADRGLGMTNVHFMGMAHDTMWARDYGPLVVTRRSGGIGFIDSDYARPERPLDDEIPTLLGDAFRLPVLQTLLVVDGGNLLSNGEGVVIATRELVLKNMERGWREETVRRLMREQYAARQLVLLEPLEGEPNGHVDMFAAFTAVDTVVVGAYHPDVDPVNAAVLDRNAARLARVTTSRGPLRVVRIPMPPRTGDNWRTYTNVVFANGVLLAPIFPGLDERGQHYALTTLSRLLPGWRVVGIDAGSLSELCGGLHCVTMNLGPLRNVPQLPLPLGAEAHPGGELSQAGPGPSFTSPWRMRRLALSD